MWGIVPSGSSPTPLRKTFDRSPIHLLPVVNAREYPMNAQRIPEKPKAMKLIIIVLSAFFDRTNPP